MIQRARLLLALIFTVLMIFTGRLMYLQFAMTEEFRALSDENFLEQRRISPLRGRILARDGTVLADNRIAVDLMYWGGELDHWARIAYLLDITEAPTPPDTSDARERIAGRVLVWDIAYDLVPAIEELVAGQPNLYLRERIERTYPTNLAAHVVGHTTEADPQRFPGYALGDLVGIKGIEASYQDMLFGSPGASIVEVNSRRSVLNEREILAARPGQDVMLTIDPQLQHAAEEVLAEALRYINQRRRSQGLPLEDIPRGALVALDPRSGEILAMASQPSYDQNVFTRRPSPQDVIGDLLTDGENFPLLNRAVSAYPPASTFKLLSSLVLLEQGYIAPSTRYACSGSFEFLGIRMRNWAGYWRGSYTVSEAIADSCNTFYWQAAADTPNSNIGWAPFARELTDRATELGYGSPVGIGLDEEKAGRVPDEVYSRESRGYIWRPGDTLNISIGQGDMLATPIQVAQFTATVAMDGMQVQPHLVREIGANPVEVPYRDFSGPFWSTVRDGMRLMMTRYGARPTLGPGNFPVATAGKTGTAQNAQGDGLEHAWFTGFGPMDNPELVVVAFIENGGSSTAVAIPVARDFMARFWDVDLGDR
ncbi:MAG: penicillin-binding transpeptidase domain-containing protein [Trueperaceae bacterium]|nr:penicillin-binding transpeptidase domain-containing protein [Trueperaceae bacterium]